MKDLLKETISIAKLIANNIYNLEISYELEDDQIIFTCEGKQFKVEVNELYYSFINIDEFEFVCTRDVLVEKEYYQLFSYHINYWLHKISRHAVINVLFEK